MISKWFAFCKLFKFAEFLMSKFNVLSQILLENNNRKPKLINQILLHKLYIVKK